MWAWVNTCRINKTSSAEVSESINSMFSWHWDSTVCYVLKDVPLLSSEQSPWEWKCDFLNAHWFTSGWCLQKLIVPLTMVSYAMDWSIVGTKHQLLQNLDDTTEITERALLGWDLW